VLVTVMVAACAEITVPVISAKQVRRCRLKKGECKKDFFFACLALLTAVSGGDAESGAVWG
jgi:hypothetical protein